MERAKGVSLSFMAALYLCVIQGSGGATFKIQNNCQFTVWAAAPPSDGMRLDNGELWTLDVPAGTTSGRIWGRTGCSFNSSGRGSCNTGDCAGLLNCQVSGTLATLFEYSLNQNNLDFYDISLVDGFNLPISVIPSNSSCKTIACSRNITAVCPAILKVTDGCKGGCASVDTDSCGPNNYTKLFKAQCPQVYTYPKDDTATFICSGGTDYNVSFCGSAATASQGQVS